MFLQPKKVRIQLKVKWETQLSNTKGSRYKEIVDEVSAFLNKLDTKSKLLHSFQSQDGNEITC